MSCKRDRNANQTATQNVAAARCRAFWIQGEHASIRAKGVPIIRMRLPFAQAFDRGWFWVLLARKRGGQNEPACRHPGPSPGGLANSIFERPNSSIAVVTGSFVLSGARATCGNPLSAPLAFSDCGTSLVTGGPMKPCKARNYVLFMYDVYC